MGKFSEFKVQLRGLPDGVHEFDFHLGPQFFANMENTDVRDADVDVRLTVTVSNGHYDMLFHMQGKVVVLCDRCLDDMDLPIDAEYHIMVQYGEDYNDEADDLLIIPQADNYLNVAYMIYDTVALAIPMKHVHPMGKCNKQMTAILRKHRSTRAADPDADLENDLIDEMDNIESTADDEEPTEKEATDPRWDALKGLASDQ